MQQNTGKRQHIFRDLENVDMGVSKNGDTQNGWFIMENFIKVEDLGVLLFSETSI